MHSEGYNTWSCVGLFVCLSVCLSTFVLELQATKQLWAILKRNKGSKNSVAQIMLKVLYSWVIVWKPSEQAKTLISFGLPRPGSACFVFRGCTRSHTKGNWQDLLKLDCCWLFSQQCTMVGDSACLTRLTHDFSFLWMDLRMLNFVRLFQCYMHGTPVM